MLLKRPLRLVTCPIDFSDTSMVRRYSSRIGLTWAVLQPFIKLSGRQLVSIPYGETRTYAWVAQQIGKPRALRAVGGALARNPFPIIVPCHRVVASNGNLGGFRGGLALKKRLLELEAGRLDVLS